MAGLAPWAVGILIGLAVVTGGLAIFSRVQLDSERRDNAVLSSNISACEIGQDKLREALQAVQELNAQSDSEARAEIIRMESAAANSQAMLSEVSQKLTRLQAKLREKTDYSEWADAPLPPSVSESLGNE